MDRVEPEVRYGRRFAETEDRAKQKQKQHKQQGRRRLEELSPPQPDRLKMSVPYAPGRVYPIGAVPLMEELPAVGPVRQIVDSGRRNLRLLRESVRDGVAASVRLAMLPVVAARTVVHAMARPWTRRWT